MTFIESFARRIARSNADSLTVTKGDNCTLFVRYANRSIAVEDDPAFPEKTLAAVRVAIDQVMGKATPEGAS